MKALLTSRFVKSKSEEIRIMSKLNSPFTIRYIEAFQEGIMLCIVMEYCQVIKIEFQLVEFVFI